MSQEEKRKAVARETGDYSVTQYYYTILFGIILNDIRKRKNWERGKKIKNHSFKFTTQKHLSTLRSSLRAKRIFRSDG